MRYALSIARSLVIGWTGGHQSRLIGLGSISLLIPAISVLITNSVKHETGSVEGLGPRLDEFL